MFFASDNGAPAHQNIMDALQTANAGYTSGYGAESIMQRVTDKIRDIFDAPHAAVYLVPTGTAANALALACITKPWETIYCHRNSHIEEDECGAPEFYTNGSKLTLIEGDDAIMDPNHFEKMVKFTARAGVHNVQKGSLSITNVTECGAVYTLDQIQALTKIAKDNEIKCHLDGARFANAMMALECSPADMTWKSGIDVVSFGGTKNGLLGVEAVVIFDAEIAWEFELRRKRGGHLFSKHRFLSAQMEAYLDGDLWRDLATNANAMAQCLKTGLQGIQGAELLHPVDANMIFVKFPRAAHKRAMDAGAKYYFWPGDQSLEGPSDELLSARLVCSWSTTKDDIDALITALK